jgi:hypothetical protein
LVPTCPIDVGRSTLCTAGHLVRDDDAKRLGHL